MPTHEPGKQPQQKSDSARAPSGEQPQSAPDSSLGRRGQLAPHLLTPSDVLQLQRTIGNRAVAQLLGRQSPPVQRAPAPTQSTGKPIEKPSTYFARQPTPSTVSQGSTSISSSAGIIQRHIDQNFTQTAQQPNKQTVGDFFTKIVTPEYLQARKVTKNVPHLSNIYQALDDTKNKFLKAVGIAIQQDTPQTWQLAVQELDELVRVTNEANSESKRPFEWIAEGDEEYPPLEKVPIPGPMTKEGVLDNWNYDAQDVLNPNDYISFYHATTAKGKIEGKQIEIMQGSKEFGPGFYTTATDIDAPAKKIGQEWFTDKQKNPDWVIIRFSIPKNYTSFLQSKNPALNVFLNHILTHSTGYPSGGNAPDQNDIANINAINLEGRVLIFPDNKTTKVQTTFGERSWEEYTANKLGGGEYQLVIGPQQPTYMGNWRQYAFTGSRAVWMMNTARRFIAYDHSSKKY